MRNPSPAFSAPSAAPSASGSAAGRRTAGRPNVIIFLADDMGYSDAGCYGGEIETPNIDRLAAAGIRFTQSYDCARCVPSRSSILTGYYAQQVNADGKFAHQMTAFPAWTRLLPQLLHAAGYRSYHSGKWHVSCAADPRQDGGFDKSMEARQETIHHASDLIAAHAVACLETHADRHPDRPFFAYVCFTTPHFPLTAAPGETAKYRETYRAGWDAVRQRRFRRLQAAGIVRCTLAPLEPAVKAPYFTDDCCTTFGPGELAYAQPWDTLNASQREFQSVKMAIHAASIERMDREVGRLLDQVKLMGAWDNTLIFFLSDHSGGGSSTGLLQTLPTRTITGSRTTRTCTRRSFSTCLPRGKPRP